MPELPEVETLRRGLATHLCGRTLTDVIVRRRHLREPLPSDIKRRLVGLSVVAVRRRAKYLLLVLPPETLLAHLGMSGGFTLSPLPPLEKHAHLGFELDDGKFLIYTDPRRFGRITLTRDDPKQHPWLKHLGPEPLTAAFCGAMLRATWKNKTMPVKTALMDARQVAGIGNIYAAESLFAAGVHPNTAAGALSAAQTEQLARAVKKVLRRAVRAGGSSMRDFADADGKPGYFQTRWAVYGRAELPCVRCDSHIRRTVQSGRATYYCPKCQK